MSKFESTIDKRNRSNEWPLSRAMMSDRPTPKSVAQPPSSSPWIEKYRPGNLSDICGQTKTVALFKSMLDTTNSLHFLFHGPPGTGKTSTISSFCNELYGKKRGSSYVLKINASYDSGIDMVRNKIRPFCKRSTAPFMRNNRRINYKMIILDEADTLTADAQNALRRCIEMYSYNTRFCFLCNYVCNISSPILSRCTVCYFHPLAPTHAIPHLEHICEIEGVPCTRANIQKVHEVCKGDMRRCLSVLQSIHTLYGKITEDAIAEHTQRLEASTWEALSHATNPAVCDTWVRYLVASCVTLHAAMQSLVCYAIEHLADEDIHTLSITLARLEVQSQQGQHTKLLLRELVMTAWAILHR